MVAPSRATGLDRAEIAQRLADVGPNELTKPQRLQWLRTLAKQLANLFAVLLVVSALLCFVADRMQPGEGMATLGWALLGVAVLNALFTFAAHRARIVANVPEGRAIFANIRKFTSYVSTSCRPSARASARDGRSADLALRGRSAGSARAVPRRSRTQGALVALGATREHVRTIMTTLGSFGIVLVAVVALAAGGACSSSGPPFVAGLPQVPEPSTTCPFGVSGARVRMSNTDDGVVIALRAYGDLQEVRRRARDSAAMYGPGARRGLGHDGKHGGGHQHGLGLATLGVPVQAEAEDTPEGALILVRPKTPGDLERMRAALWKREGSARAGKCP